MELLAGARRLGVMGSPSCIVVRLTAIARAGYSNRRAALIRMWRIWPTAGIVCLFVVSFACATAWADEPKRVMVLHSFGPNFKPWSEHAKAIRTELDRQSPWPLQIIDKSLLTARSDDDNPEVPYVEYLRALFAKRPLDLIVTIGAPAANFLQRHRQQLFTQTPTLFTAVERRRIQHSSLTENDTIVAIAQNFPAIIENILHVLPDTKTVAVVIGNSPLERLWLEVLRNEFAPFAERISFIWYHDRSLADILKHATALPSHSAIYWHQMNVDAAGVVHEGGKALPALHAVANAPIFTFNDAFFGGEVVGGPMNSVVEGSRLAAAVAVRILGGEKAGDIETTPIGFATPKFDWREMQRWGISESRLPPGSEIHFRNLTLWEQYRLQIVGFISIVLGQFALIGWLIYEYRRRQVAEADSLRRVNELAHMNRIATVGELSASIAHELKQPLAAIVVAGSAGLRWLAREVPDVDEVRANLQRMINDGNRASMVIDEVRAMFRKDNSRATLVDVNRLILDTLSLTNHEIKTHNISVQTTLFESSTLLVLADRVQLQQVILNLIVNAIEAMNSTPGARELRIASGLHDADGVLITIEDSGPGIAPENLEKIFNTFFTTKPNGMGMGLSICRSIIKAHGGRLWASGVAPHRCIFHVVLPRCTP
jgi:signal transduction histidine kinase